MFIIESLVNGEWTDSQEMIGADCDPYFSTHQEAKNAMTDLINNLGWDSTQMRVAEVNVISTPDDVLKNTHIGNGFHMFALEGGSVTVNADTLRAALDGAYDPSMPNWVEFVDLE